MKSGIFALCAALVGGACSVQISNGGSQLGGSLGDPTADAALQCTKRVVYLNFEGQTLTQGRSDATVNQAEWMQNPSGTAPPYLAGDANRATTIQGIVDGVRAQLARFPITVVTTRPPSGNYVMVVYGGQRAAVGSRYGTAVNRLDCDDSRPNDVAWISDSAGTVQHAVNLTIGAIGFGLGLTATTFPLDCMCGWDNGCTSIDTAPCTLSETIDRDPKANQTCGGAPKQQDEVASLRDAFCQ
jgi:hypothetical protein